MNKDTARRIIDAIDRGEISSLRDAKKLGFSSSYLSAMIQRLRDEGVEVLTNEFQGGRRRLLKPWKITKRSGWRRAK